MKGTATITGRLGKNAQTADLKNGNNVIEFSAASNSYFRDKEGNSQETTDWHDVKIFVKDVSQKFLELLTKGREVTVFGNISYNEYTDNKESKQKRMFIDARPSNVTIHGLTGTADAAEAQVEEAEEIKDDSKA